MSKIITVFLLLSFFSINTFSQQTEFTNEKESQFLLYEQANTFQHLLNNDIQRDTDFLNRQQDINLQLIAGCCKVCRKGKACGNSCINRNYSCYQPPGCACNG